MFLVFILQVRKTSAQLAMFSMNDKKAKAMEIRISKMVISIVAIFLFCNSFQVVAFSMLAGTRRENFSSYVVVLLGYFLTAVNSSLNAVVYGIFNKKCRVIFFKYFCCQSSKKSNETCPKPLWIEKNP